MIVHNFHVMRFALPPDEADSPLMIYPNTMLSNPVSFESLEPVARRNSKILKTGGRIEIDQLAASYAFDRVESGHHFIEKQGPSVPARNDRINMQRITPQVLRQE